MVYGTMVRMVYDTMVRMVYDTMVRMVYGTMVRMVYGTIYYNTNIPLYILNSYKNKIKYLYYVIFTHSYISITYM
jgi:hypothetical protein